MDLLKLPPFRHNAKTLAKEPGEHLQAAQIYYWKMQSIRDKSQRYLQIKDELQQLSHNTLFWDAWISDTLQKLSTSLEVDKTQPLSHMRPYNAKLALKAAGDMIAGVIQHSGSFIVELEKNQGSVPVAPSILQLQRLEKDLFAAILGSSSVNTTPTVQVEPLVRLKEEHPLSVVASKVFGTLSDLLKEICTEADAQKQLKELQDSLQSIKSFLYINAHLCLSFLTLVRLADVVTTSKSEVLDEEAKTIISTLVHAFPDSAVVTVTRPTLEALKGTSVLTALKEDGEMMVMFSDNPPAIPCPCKANKCLRFGILTVLLALHKSAKLTHSEWKLIQSRIMEQYRMNLFEPDYRPFLEVDMIVLSSLQKLFQRFPKTSQQPDLPTLSRLDEQL